MKLACEDTVAHSMNLEQDNLLPFVCCLPCAKGRAQIEGRGFQRASVGTVTMDLIPFADGPLDTVCAASDPSLTGGSRWLSRRSRKLERQSALSLGQQLAYEIRRHRVTSISAHTASVGEEPPPALRLPRRPSDSSRLSSTCLPLPSAITHLMCSQEA